jgi:hypothetical protein
MTIDDKKTKKNYQPLIIAGLALLLACSLTWAIRERGAKKIAQTIAEPSKVLKDPTAPTVKDFVDSLKQNHKTFNNTSNVVGGKEVAISKGLVDTISKMSNIKPDQITEWKQIITRTEGRALRAERKVDSLQRETFFYKDKYLQLAYRRGNPADTTDKGTFDFLYDADLSVTQFSTRGKILGFPIGSRKLYTDIYSNDPRTTIRGLKTFRVETMQPKSGIRFQLVTNYSFGRANLQFGLGSQVDLGRLSIVGTYYYSPAEKLFNPNIGARYDLIR